MSSSAKSRNQAPSRIRNQFGKFAQIPDALVLDPDISDRAIRVYALLWTYSNKSDRDAFPARQKLADDLHVSKATVDRGIAELRRRGAVTVEERWDGDRQTSNIYTLVAPLPPAPKSQDLSTWVSDLTPPLLISDDPGGLKSDDPLTRTKRTRVNGPVPNAIGDGAVDNSATGPSITPATVSRTHRQPLHPPSIFASVGKMLPPSFDDAQLLELCREILEHAGARVVEDPTAYVIRSIRNTVRHVERDRGKWLLRADEIAVEHLELSLRGSRF